MRRPSIALALAALFAALLLPAQPAGATPVQGYLPWSILLCKFADRPAEPRPPSYFEELFLPVGRGGHGVYDFIEQQSRGRATTAGSVVKGWYTMPYTWQQSKDASRFERIDQCVRTVKAAGYTPPADHRVAVMLNDGNIDSGGDGFQRVVLDANGWRSGLAAHELMHAHGLSDGSSNDLSYRNSDWAAPGQYDDPWDIMSADAHYAATWTEKFGKGMIGLNGPRLDEVGWLPQSRATTVGQDGRTSATHQLAPLERQDLPGLLMLRIPFDAHDLNHYYTVEFRKKTGMSAGIPRDTVLIHEVDKGQPILQRDLSNREPLQAVNANGVSIRVDAVTADSATVTVTTNMPGKCVSGYVYRLAVPEDRVCVTPETRTQTARDNEDASVWEDDTGDCILNRTRRLAVPGDSVCVTQSTRLKVISDNKTAASRINPTKHFYGPNTCKGDYIWRVADDSDLVCVTRATYDQTLADNQAAASRWVNGPWGPQSCVYGYVWREAFIGDKVCVTGAVRAQAREDNRTAGDRVDPPWD
ncbi:hypothetical protein OIE66_16600 [Nonomuraea sp. NBC_01738]|uniref:hypothetical protein n=1 Tax=Nonomuraea sp. NBC_01738 TaxID=2976003 RepID=UPI002E154CD8|nr:hypothetical protein OIE66_16600 [Nonomuraea sp. NBC_01738]